MKEMSYWAIEFENYEGGDSKCYFADYATAMASFEKLCEKYSEYAEFERDDNSCSWFDSDYNEYSTYAYLAKTAIVVNEDVINW